MKIAIYAGSFNPPGLHHCQIIDLLINILIKYLLSHADKAPVKKELSRTDTG